MYWLLFGVLLSEGSISSVWEIIFGVVLSEGSISSVWEIIFGVLLSEGSISSVLEITFSVLLSEGSISSVLEITFSVLLSEGSGILLFEGSNICGVDKVFIFKEDLLLFEGSIYHLKELIQYCTVFSSLRFADWC